MNHKNPERVIQEIARDNLTKEVNLLPGLLAQVSAENRRSRGLKKKLLIAVPTIAVLSALFFVSAPVTASALSRLLGYMPGIGLVEKSAPMRALSAPVKATRSEVTITVKKVLLDASQSVVSYSVDNLLLSDYVNTPKFKDERCAQLPYLRLVDGTKLQGNGNLDRVWASGYSRKLTYPAIPPEASEAVLIFPCLEQTIKKDNPANWEIPLRFVPAPADKTVYPVVDLPVKTDAVRPPTRTPTALPPTPEKTATQAGPRDDFQFSFERYVPLDEGYVIYGKIQSRAPDTHFMWVDPAALHLSDSQGEEIPLEEEDRSAERPAVDRQQYPLAYKTGAVLTPGAATLTIDSIWVNQMVDSSFVFDPGPDVKPGRTWPLKREVKIGEYALKIESAELDAAGKFLTFIFAPDSVIQTAVLTDPDLPLTGADGGGGGEGSAGIFYSEGFPRRAITVKVNVISYNLAGPWKMTLDLPVQNRTARPTAPIKSCLSDESWENAPDLKENDLNPGLDGILAVSYTSREDPSYNMLITRPDGSRQQRLGRGEGLALSPDGTQAVYNGAAGLEMLDLTDGQKAAWPGTRRGDRDPLWSPDGSELAFTRGPASGLISAPGPRHVWVADADGSNPRPLTRGREANHAAAWTPDGKSILMIVEKEDGASIRSLDVGTGDVKPLFEINYAHGHLAISPDGKRLAFEQMLPGDKYGIYVSDLDGSHQRLAAAPETYIATAPLWSPDGKWLVFSIYKENSAALTTDLGLVQVDTCRVLRLPQLTGHVTGWYRIRK